MEEIEYGLITSSEPPTQEYRLPPPPFTVWESRRFCGLLPGAYIPEISAHFIGHWEIQPIMPSLVTGLVIASLCTFCAGFSVKERITVLPVLVALAVLFLYAYWRIISTGPGYLPFYWEWANMVGFAGDPSDPFEMAGIHNSKQDQLPFVQIAVRPPRSVFASSARRFVVRPDHFCLWTASWIGKKNHKFFVLFNVYGIIYCGTGAAYALWYAIHIFVRREVSWFAVACAIMGIAGIAFIGLTLRFFLNSLWLGTQNMTNWENWNLLDMSGVDQGSKCANLSDVMGKPGWRWLCPVDPWPNESLAKLMAEYPSYDEVLARPATEPTLVERLCE
jgi:hypothetical protein